MRRARPEWADWLARRGRRRARGGRHARARPPPPRRTARCAARSATAPAEELHARALAQPHLDWPRMLAEPELASPPPALDACVTEPFTVGAGPRVVVLDLGCKRSIVRRLAETGVEAVVVPGTWDADAMLELDPRRGADRQRPRRPGAARRPDRDRARAARAGAALRDLPRPPARRARARPARRSSSRSATAAPTTPSACTGSKRVLVTAQNHGFAVAPGDAAEVSHVSLNDGTVEGLARRRLRDAPVPPRGRARPARRRSLLRPDRRRVPKRTDLRSILIVGSGPIRIGQGCEFDYAGVAGLPRAARRGLPRRARRTRTRRRS